MLLATTNQVCLDVAVIPFLWVLPLALYLVTFILCFDSDRWYSRRPYSIAAAVSRTERVTTPSMAMRVMYSLCASGRGTRPRVALRPTRPQKEAGMRVEERE